MTTPNKVQQFFEVMEQTPELNFYNQWLLIQERKIFLNKDIDQSVVDTVTMQIELINSEDDKNNVPINERKPIKIYVNSYGGSVYDGFSAVNAILTSRTPVWTYCTGYAMSMGLAIFIAGHRRFGYRYSNFMYHELSSLASGKAEEIKRATKEYERLQDMYDSILIERTGLTKQKLTKVKKEANDWYFDTKEAVKYNVVTDVIE